MIIFALTESVERFKVSEISGSRVFSEDEDFLEAGAGKILDPEEPKLL